MPSSKEKALKEKQKKKAPHWSGKIDIRVVHDPYMHDRGTLVGPM